MTAVVDGTSATRAITLPAQSSTPLRLSLPASAHTLEVRLDGHDALPADDSAWADAPAPVWRTILLVSNTPGSVVAQALRAIPYVHVEVLAPHSPAITAQARRADLTVVEGASADGIPGNLLVIDSSAARSTLLGALTPVHTPAVTAINSASPLLRGVDLSSLVLYTAATTSLPTWAHTDVSSSAGPLLFDGTTGGREVAVLLIDPQIHTGAHGVRTGSNLSTLLAFPALLQNAVEALGPTPPVNIAAGQVAAEPARTGESAWIHWAPGQTTPLPTSGAIAAIPALPPGSYTLSGGVTGAVTANAPVPADPLSQQVLLPVALPVTHLLVPPVTAAPWEIWPLVILLVLLVLCGEWWYYTCRT